MTRQRVGVCVYNNKQTHVYVYIMIDLNYRLDVGRYMFVLVTWYALG